MKVTMLLSATSPAKLDDMGRTLINHPDLKSLSDAFYNVYENVTIDAAVVNRIDLEDAVHYHVLGMMDEDGISYTVDNSCEGEVKAKLSDVPDGFVSPFAELIEKGNRYNKLLSALGTHKLRLVSTTTGKSLDTENDLLTLLNTLLNDKETVI